MSDDEIDAYLVQILGKILSDLKENREYLKGKGGDFLEELLDDCDDAISEVQDLVDKVHTVEDLAALGDDAVMIAFEYLEDYAGNFVLSSDEPERSKNQAEYEKLEDLLYLFYDADEDEEE